MNYTSVQIPADRFYDSVEEAERNNGGGMAVCYDSASSKYYLALKPAAHIVVDEGFDYEASLNQIRDISEFLFSMACLKDDLVKDAFAASDNPLKMYDIYQKLDDEVDDMIEVCAILEERVREAIRRDNDNA